jgi:apolipoprotein D and lipocalin family protein
MKFLPLGTACAALWLAACAAPNPNPHGGAPLVPAAQVDLARFMGRWYVIANIPYFAERGSVGAYVEYALREDGDIDDFYCAHPRSFEAPLQKTALRDTVVPDSHNAVWKVSPFWPLSFTIEILYVDPDYQYALLGSPDKSLGWVYARSPDIDDATYHALLARLDAQGYDVSRLRRIPQRIEQLGLPGFQSP